MGQWFNLWVRVSLLEEALAVNKIKGFYYFCGRWAGESIPGSGHIPSGEGPARSYHQQPHLCDTNSVPGYK